MRSGVGEILVFSDLRIRISFEQVKLAFPSSDSRAGHNRSGIGSDRCVLRVVPALVLFRRQLGRSCCNAHPLLIGRSHSLSESRCFRACGSFSITNSRASRSECSDCNQSDVDLTSLDVLFGNGRGLVLLMDELDPLSQFLVVVDDGGLGNAH